MLESASAALHVAEQASDRRYIYLAKALAELGRGPPGAPPGCGTQMAEAQKVGQALGGRCLLADWFAAASAERAIGGRPDRNAVAGAERAVTLAQAVGGLFAEGLGATDLGRSARRIRSGTLGRDRATPDSHVLKLSARATATLRRPAPT